LHEGDHFHAWTGRLIALVNEYASVDGSEADVFRTIVHLERRFFEDSYPQQ
jgi:thiaminase/transcriptional activator TenA